MQRATHNVQEGAKCVDSGSCRLRDAAVCLDLTELGVVAAIAGSGVGLDAGEDESQEDGDAHADGRDGAHERDVIEGPGQTDDDADNSCDALESDSANRVVRKTVKDLGASKDVEADNHDVVREKHEACSLVGETAGIGVELGGELSHVVHVRMLHAPLPQ